MRRVIRYILVSAWVCFLVSVFGCTKPILHAISPIQEHPEGEADCNQFDNCEACASNVACGWCGNTCHAAGVPRSESPAACHAPAEVPWIWKAQACPSSGPPPPPPPVALIAD